MFTGLLICLKNCQYVIRINKLNWGVWYFWIISLLILHGRTTQNSRKTYWKMFSDSNCVNYWMIHSKSSRYKPNNKHLTFVYKSYTFSTVTFYCILYFHTLFTISGLSSINKLRFFHYLIKNAWRCVE